MLPSDADRLFKEVLRPLFPNWKPADGLASFWLERLERYPDARIVENAIKEHAAGSKWNRPTLADVAMQVQQIVGGDDHVADQIGNWGFSGVWIQCVTPPLAHPTRLGWYVPMNYVKDSDIPPDHVVLSHAHRAADAHAKLYGGEWVVMTDATAPDMLQAREDVRIGALT